MSLQSINRAQSEFTPPYFRFVESSKTITYQGIEVYPYISPENTSKIVRSISNAINLRAFDNVFVNLRGGLELSQDLVDLQKFEGNVLQIRYPRPSDNEIYKPIIKIDDRYKYHNNLIIEDILDSGETSKEMLKDSPYATIVFLLQKREITNQFLPPKKIVGAKIDDVWVGGKGLNLESPGDGLPKDFGRDYNGIIVKKQTS